MQTLNKQVLYLTFLDHIDHDWMKLDFCSHYLAVCMCFKFFVKLLRLNSKCFVELSSFFWGFFWCCLYFFWFCQEQVRFLHGQTWVSFRIFKDGKFVFWVLLCYAWTEFLKAARLSAALDLTFSYLEVAFQCLNSSILVLSAYLTCSVLVLATSYSLFSA